MARGEQRDAAWFALWADELEPSSGLGLAVLARILHSIGGEALSTLGTREALGLLLPEPERTEVARFHRIDLWSLGLLEHVGGQAILPAATFDDPALFEETELHEAWFRERGEGWSAGPDGIRRAVRRLVGALSDALEVPEEASSPLRGNSTWHEMPAYAAWKAENPLSLLESEPDTEAEPSPVGITVVSDFWTARQIERLHEQGRISEAREIAERWVELRPGRIPPRIALLRVFSETGQQDRALEVEREILDSETEDLNELEEARVGLGLLGRYDASLEILDRMARLAPGHPTILAHRGAVALELDRPEEAETDLQLALQLDPENGAALTNLALLRMRESDYLGARSLLEHAKTLHPDEAQVRYYLATCLQNQGHGEAALHEARAAVDKDPGFAPGHALLEQLGG